MGKLTVKTARVIMIAGGLLLLCASCDNFKMDSITGATEKSTPQNQDQEK